MHYGYTYFLQVMFALLCVIVLFQASAATSRDVRGGRGWGGGGGEEASRTSAAACRPPTTFKHCAQCAVLSTHSQRSSHGPLTATSCPLSVPACSGCLQVGGSIIFIVCHWFRRWTGRDTDKAVRRSPSGTALPRAGGAAGGLGGPPGGPMGSAKSFYSSEAGGSEVEIAIQPGSARFAGGQTFVPPHSGEQAGRGGWQEGEGWGGGGGGGPGGGEGTGRWQAAAAFPHGSCADGVAPIVFFAALPSCCRAAD